MSPKVALLLCVVWIVYVFRADRWRAANLSKALFWPTLWFLVASSRPIGVWFDIWGLPLPGDSGSAADGSIIDRLFYGGLSLIGLVVLSRRQVRWNVLARENPWLVVLMAYLLMSVAWSNFPMVSLKRYVKLFGSVIMAVVVLTEANRVDAITALVRRCAFIHMPMSILVTRYYRDIGVAWDFGGTSSSWQGISTSKNVLGQIAMLSAIVFIWERTRRNNPKKCRWIDFAYIGMSVFLLKGEEGRISMTSITVFALGLAVFWALRNCANQPAKAGRILKTFLFGLYFLVFLVSVHSVVHFSEHSFFGSIITVVGRDITLTGRTLIWDDVYQVADRSPILGVGFGGFWIGRIANIPWNAGMSWILGQGHNGYIDTFLQGGWCGVILLVTLLFTSTGRIIRAIGEDFEYGRFCAMVLCVVIFVNITESTFLRGEHNLWLIFLLAVITVPAYAYNSQTPPTATKTEAELADEMDEESMRGPAVFP
jgi:exopolysaccharide production protein ExoQ